VDVARLMMPKNKSTIDVGHTAGKQYAVAVKGKPGHTHGTPQFHVILEVLEDAIAQAALLGDEANLGRIEVLKDLNLLCQQQTQEEMGAWMRCFCISDCFEKPSKTPMSRIRFALKGRANTHTAAEEREREELTLEVEQVVPDAANPAGKANSIEAILAYVLCQQGATRVAGRAPRGDRAQTLKGNKPKV